MSITVDKVFEQLLAGQLEPLYNKVFDGLNSAYRKRYSCETTLVRLVEDWKRSLDNNHTVGVLSTDMSKAFDCLSPVLLLSKLLKLMVYVETPPVLNSYFTKRKNRVQLGDMRMESSQTRMPPGVIIWPSVVEFFTKMICFIKKFDLN